MKKLTTIRVEESLLRTAQASGLNLSKWVETKLQEYMKINSLKSPDEPIRMRREGFEPSDPYGTRPSIWHL